MPCLKKEWATLEAHYVFFPLLVFFTAKRPDITDSKNGKLDATVLAKSMPNTLQSYLNKFYN
jgi:hypothetical protein